MNIRFAEEKDKEKIINIWNYCFDDGAQFTDYYFNNRYNKYNTIVIEEDEDIISSLQLNQYKIELDNKIYDTSYIVGVSTLPHARGKGYMKHLMEYTLNELYEKQQIVSILMPIDYRLYRKYGYENCYDQIEYHINIEDLSGFKSNGQLKKVSAVNLDELIKIQSEFLENTNGKVVRDREYYQNLFEEVKSENGNIYIHSNNKSDGYIIYFIENKNLFVRELYYNNLNALKGMLKFIYNHNTQCKKVIITAPVNDLIRHVLPKPKVADIKIKPFMMGRVINFKKYLEKIYIENNINENINISVVDNYIKENNKVFKINMANNRINVEVGNFEADIEFNINTISQLVFSYIDVEEALLLNNIDKDKEIVRKLSFIFNKKLNYINEYI